MPDPFLIFGHRGSPKRVPENTIASFEEALRAGADGFETDLRLLSDRNAVLYHDDEWQEQEIESLTSVYLREAGLPLTSLRDLARFARQASGRQTTMILEVKRSNWEDVLLAEIESWPNAVVASFDHSTIAELYRRGVSFDLGLTIFGVIVDVASYARRLGATWLFPAYRFVDRKLVDACRAQGIKVVPWTVNRERDWEHLREDGCDGMITDLPAEAVEWRRGRTATR